MSSKFSFMENTENEDLYLVEAVFQLFFLNQNWYSTSERVTGAELAMRIILINCIRDEYGNWTAE